MQSTNSPKPTEFWWLSLEAFDDITVEDTEEGFALTAPDESEAGKWLAHYNSTEELHAQFTQELTKALMDRVKHYDTQEEING
jgi:DUF438 domain-containing protein